MKSLLLSFWMLFLATASMSQKPCSGSEYRQFDFWLGEWEAFGINGQKAGDSRISVLLDSCVILEEWTSAATAKGIRFAGKSYNSYNASTRKWQQYWVDNTGGSTSYLNGRFEEKKMIVETAGISQPDGSTKIQRMTFFDLGPDKVRQFGQSSTDNGLTWKTDFDLEYRRKK